MASLRRGVSEVYSALLVLLIAVGVTAAVYAAAGAAARGVEEAGAWVARLASDSAAPVVIVPEVRGGDLWVSYESLGSPVAKVIAVDASAGSVLAEAPASGHRGEVRVLPGYDCRPVAIAVVLESGAVKVYDARLDPRFAGSTATPYFTCQEAQGPSQKGASQASQAAPASTPLSINGSTVTLIDYAPGPGAPSVAWRPLSEPVTISFTLTMKLTQSTLDPSNACDSARLLVEGSPVDMQPYSVEGAYGASAEGVRGLIATIEGVNVYLTVVCGNDYYAIVALESEAPLRLQADLSMLATYRNVSNPLDLDLHPNTHGVYLITAGNASYTAVATRSTLAASASVEYRAELQGEAEALNGRVVVAGAWILVSATKLTGSMRLDGRVSVLGVGDVSPGEPVEVPLPESPLRVAIASYEYDGRPSTLVLSDALRALLEAAPQYYLKVSAGQGSAVARLTPGTYVDIPRGGLHASIVINLAGPCSPLAGAPNVVESIDRGSLAEYRYEPGPQLPIGACKPHIIVVDVGGSVTLIAVEPYSGAPNVVYLGEEWEALAPVIQGLSSQSDTIVEAAFLASIQLPPGDPVVTVDLRKPPVGGVAVSGLAKGFYIAMVNGVALAVYAG